MCRAVLCCAVQGVLITVFGCGMSAQQQWWLNGKATWVCPTVPNGPPGGYLQLQLALQCVCGYLRLKLSTSTCSNDRCAACSGVVSWGGVRAVEGVSDDLCCVGCGFLGFRSCKKLLKSGVCSSWSTTTDRTALFYYDWVWIADSTFTVP